MKKNQIIGRGIILVSLLSFTNSIAFAQDDSELQQAGEKVCERIIYCSKEQIKKEEGELAPEMLAMLDNMTQNMCQSVFAYKEFVDMFDIRKDLIKCYQEMATQSCEDFSEGKELPACEALDKKFDDN